MGEEILIGNLNSWLFLVFIYGILGSFFAIICFLGFMNDKNRSAVALVVAFYIAGWILMISPGWSLRANYTRQNEAIYLNAAQVEKEYSLTKLYLKEYIVEPGTWGEIRGSFGGFLFVSGSIYGKIDSGRVITLIYQNPEEIKFINEQYRGKHLVFSKPLVDIVIETIPAGEKPYLMFPEAFVGKDPYDKLKVYPGKPHLYLPEGWVIL